MIDLQQVRKDTPGCSDKLFFNSAGSSLPPAQVTQVMIDYLRKEELVGGYALSNIWAEEIGGVYHEVAKLIHGQPHNVAITYNATDSYARALESIPFKEGDTILTTIEDYVSNQIQFISLQKRLGIRVVHAPTLENGDLDLDRLESMVKTLRPKLVAVTHVPTSSGMIQDVAAVGEICKEFDDCYYLVDACQSVGQIEVDVQRIGCDFLSVTGRKFLRGPRGTGFLYVADRVLKEGLTPLMPDLRGAEWTGSDKFSTMEDAKRFEFWEFQYAGVLGLKAAASYANKIGMPSIAAYNKVITDRLRKGLSLIAGVRLLDRGSRLSNIVTIRKSAVEESDMKAFLDQHQVYYSVTQASSALYDFKNKGIDWALRLSTHYFNTEDEVDRLLEKIEAM